MFLLLAWVYPNMKIYYLIIIINVFLMVGGAHKLLTAYGTYTIDLIVSEFSSQAS